MVTRLRNLSVREVSLVDKGANKKKVFLMKRDDEQAEAEVLVAKTDADPAPALEAAPEVVVEAPVAKVDEPSAEAIAKAAVEAQVVELQKALVAAQAEAKSHRDALEKTLADEREATEFRAAITKAATDFSHLPTNADEIGPALRALHKAAPEAASKVEALLKQVDALLNQTLAPVGKAAAGDNDGAWDKVQKLAQAKIEKGEATSLAKAIDAVLVENKELYSAIQAEKV